MDYMVKVEGGGSASLIRSARTALRVIALATLAAAVTACGGGGGGGGGDGNNPPETGSLRVTVRDTFGASVQGASVQATVGSSTRSGTTDAGGVVLLNSVAVGSASVAVSRATFVSQTVSASITASQTTELAVELVRATSAAGGSLATRDPGGPPCHWRRRSDLDLPDRAGGRGQRLPGDRDPHRARTSLFVPAKIWPPIERTA